MRGALLGSVLLFSASLIACRREPVACVKFNRKDGTRASLTQLDKGTSTFEWSECSDKKTRVLWCTTGHLHRTSCTCELREGEHRTEGRVKTDDEIPEDPTSATAFANRWCEFGLK